MSTGRSAGTSTGCAPIGSAGHGGLAASDLGALLLFDFNNIRYVTSTHIGEWARDKMTRYALLSRGGDPHIWDFGSAAKHHRLNCPWLRTENIHAGMIGLRGAVAPDAGLFRAAAQEIAGILRAEGGRRHAVGVDLVEPPMVAALEAEGSSSATVSRSCSTHARSSRSTRSSC